MAKDSTSTKVKSEHNLSSRERTILRLVVDRFVGTADPVGSRALSRYSDIGLSPASIRNTMSDLEERGYLDQPHTSAGRVPTEFGYRAFVDELMDVRPLSASERRVLSERVAMAPGDIEELMHAAAHVLGELSSLLAVTLSPRFATAIFRRLDIVPMTSTKAMFVISVKSGLAKTLMLEVEAEIDETQVPAVVSLLNERLSGLTFNEIRSTAAERIHDISEGTPELVEFVLRRASVIFSEPPQHRRFVYSGTDCMIRQPEFDEPQAVRHMIEILESGELVVSSLEDAMEAQDPDRVSIRIGSENPDIILSRYSLVTRNYTVGNVSGTVGLIGPTRMDYGRVVGLVDAMASTLNYVLLQ